MPTIKLAASWSHHTVPVTTDYVPGEHEVTEEVYADAVKAGVHVEEDNGDRSSTSRPARTARQA